MKVKDLIKALDCQDPDADVCYYNINGAFKSVDKVERVEGKTRRGGKRKYRIWLI